MQVRNPINAFILLLIGAVYVFICMKASSLGITNDEAYSFHNVKSFLNAEFFCTGNTHWLNSGAIKLASVLGLESEGQIRWFSILSALGFFLVGFLWVCKLKETHLKFLAFAFVFLNPYVLDYFSLARGYAPGLMFQVFGFALFVASLENKKRNFAFGSLLLSGISVFANFTFLNFFVAFVIIYFYKQYFQKGNSFLKQKSFYIDGLLSAGIIFTSAKALFFVVNCSNDLIGAGGENFFDSLFLSFVDGLIYKKTLLSNSLVYALAGLLLALLLTSIGVGILRARKHKNTIFLFSSVFLIVLFLIVGINHLFFKLPYPAYRSAILFFPFIAINFIYFFGNLFNQKMIIYVFSLFFAVNFILSANLKSTFDFDWNADSKDAFNYLEELHCEKAGICKEHYGAFANYYQMTEKYKYNFRGELINTYLPKGISQEKNKLSEYNYLILFPPYNLNFYKNNSVKLEGVKLFPRTKTLIVKVMK